MQERRISRRFPDDQAAIEDVLPGLLHLLLNEGNQQFTRHFSHPVCGDMNRRELRIRHPGNVQIIKTLLAAAKRVPEMAGVVFLG